jgi:hypothetical protein
MWVIFYKKKEVKGEGKKTKKKLMQSDRKKWSALLNSGYATDDNDDVTRQ